MGEITLKDLLEAGVHFGHQTKRWNPKMKPFIFAEKNGVHIIDLRKTVEAAEKAKAAVHELAGQGKTVLFLGTKTQAKTAIKEEADRCSMPYVTERWLGGTLTNFGTIRKSLSKLEYLESLEVGDKIEQFSKKEALKLGKDKEKLLKTLGGIRKMDRLPSLVLSSTPRKNTTRCEKRESWGSPSSVSSTPTRIRTRSITRFRATTTR